METRLNIGRLVQYLISLLFARRIRVIRGAPGLLPSPGPNAMNVELISFSLICLVSGISRSEGEGLPDEDLRLRGPRVLRSGQQRVRHHLGNQVRHRKVLRRSRRNNPRKFGPG